MKRISILIWAACLTAQMLSAAPVSPERAVEIGKMILSGGEAKRDAGLVSIVWDGESAPTRSSETPAFYVVARDGGGFVIISGNDNVRPVLAISKDGHFETEDMPDNVKWWMERMKAYVRSTDVQTPLVRQQWEAFTPTRAANVPTGNVTDKVEHLTPEWDQGNNDPWFFDDKYIFNAFCPMDGNEPCVTGCVATSLAEVLTTLSEIYPDRMPARSTGSVGGYSVPSGYKAAPAYTLGGYDYDWTGFRSLKSYRDIQTALSQGETGQLLLENLGHLLADCGAIMEAQYSVDGTGAVSQYIPRNMAEHFFTSKTARFEKAADYTPDVWISMLKAEIYKHPVLYSGQDPDHGGHAFVLDGYGSYAGADVFHVNFGWMGSCNGYYYITGLDAGDNGNYSYNCNAIFDFYPDAGQETSYVYDIQFSPIYGTQYGDFIGLTAEYPIVKDESFYFQGGGFTNAGTGVFSGNIGLFYVDKNNYGTRGWIVYSDPLNPGASGITGGYLSFGNDICFGDKLITLFSADGSSWIPVGYPKDGTIIGELPLTPGAFIVTDASYERGDYFVFQIKNHYGLYAGTQWTITDPNGNSTTMAQSAGRYQLTQTGKYKIVASIKPDANSEVVENVVTFITVQ